MNETLYSAAKGTGGSLLAMIFGFIDVNGLLSAFLFGAAGALGGVVIKYLSKSVKKWRELKKT
ncbi:MAG: hypothetical protein QM500_08530 [Methylococcales bacterium]